MAVRKQEAIAMYRNKHHLEHAVEHLAELVLAEEHPDDLAAWAVSALAAAVRLPAAVGVVGDVNASIDIMQVALDDLTEAAGSE